MVEEPLLRSMLRLGGFDDTNQADQVARAVLTALRAGLPDDDAAAIAEHLGAPYAQVLREGAYEGPLDLPDFVGRIACKSGMYSGRIIEAVQVVCRALREVLPEDTSARLRPLLPEALRPELDEPIEPPAPSVPERKVRPEGPGEGHTLATGRPGSRHPLSESAPPSGHAQSVALSDDPHGDTKLSGARGLTQERLHETLATGHPGPEHPVAGE
jgi:uncharacterized protein (DUF2267 family)